MGIEGSHIEDFDVQIAQAAAIPDPIASEYFDGLAVWIKATRGVTGSLVLDIRALAHLKNGSSRQLDLQNEIFAKLDQDQFDQLQVSDRVVFAPGSEQVAVFGALDGDSQEGNLTLKIRID